MLSLRQRFCFQTACPEIPMRNDQELIYSDLQTTYAMDGHTLEINIYRFPESEWFLEVVDEFNNSTVWEDSFATDEAALAEAIGEIKSEGVHAFIGPHSA
jgi:hypothetical protein